MGRLSFPSAGMGIGSFTNFSNALLDRLSLPSLTDVHLFENATGLFTNATEASHDLLLGMHVARKATVNGSRAVWMEDGLEPVEKLLLDDMVAMKLILNEVSRCL